MRVLRIIITILFLTFLFSCATVPELPVPDVAVYIDPPQQYETVWIVKTDSGEWGTVQRSEDEAIKKLKREADAIGANGVIISHMAAYSHTTTTSHAHTGGYGSYTYTYYTYTYTTTYSTQAVGLAIYIGLRPDNRQMPDTQIQ